MKRKIEIYDTTLRDGAQGQGISFSPAGKLRVAKILDELGVDYIEGGYAASNPKDMAFFKDIKKENLKHARIAAFGSTRRANIAVAEDPGTMALLEADTEVCTIFGKSWRLHVKDVLRTTEDENRAMISDTVRYLKEQGKIVVYDCEHFFDGYADSAEHALSTLKAAADAGADVIVPCDTNGGTLPSVVSALTQDLVKMFGNKIGIHPHNDSELGVANALAAVDAGAMHIQGTINGFGERCGNANLTSIIPNLLLKMELDCIPPENLVRLKEVSDFVYEMANVIPFNKDPFVGNSAFAHKAGMHVDGVRKNAKSFEHIEPSSVGNNRHILISELSGTSNIFMKTQEMGLDVDRSSSEVKEILAELERLEKVGYEFEAADASFSILIQKVLKAHKPFFNLESFRVISEKLTHDGKPRAEAAVKVSVKGEIEHRVGEGDGPVDALNQALRAALTRFYPAIEDVYLTDYRVRILDPESATSAKTRVLIESSDGQDTWMTVGVSENLIEASWLALVDSVEYKLFLDERKG